MSKKCYVPYRVKSKDYRKDGLRWVVYKWEYGKIQPTYYKYKEEAEKNKNYISE